METHGVDGPNNSLNQEIKFTLITVLLRFSA